MKNLMTHSINEKCPHCDSKSFAFKHPLIETKSFWVICDVHPLVEGHILIIPKKHLSCAGEYSEELFAEFTKLYNRFSDFLKKTYGKSSTFEHGVIGQTVFHSHMHLLPYQGDELSIIYEGKDKIIPLDNLSKLRNIYQKEQKYLFFSVGNLLWTVNTSLGVPRFFRDRFAKALGSLERGNWKNMHGNKLLMEKANLEITNLENNWVKYCSNQ